MKWKCEKCVKKGDKPCYLKVESEVEPLIWCPWALEPYNEVEYPEWELISEEVPTVSRGCIANQLGYDPVNRPSHYTEGRKYEPIDVIEDWNLGFCTGNALKYISRAGRKDDALQDLEKAKWYIEREIMRMRTR